MQHILQTATEFQDLLNNIDSMMRRSLYKIRSFIDTLDLADATFYDKRRRKDWTVEEIRKMAPMLAAEAVQRKEGEQKS
jgi:hypothetical protein